MEDEAPVLIELNGLEFEIDAIVNGQGSHPPLVSGKTETGRMGRRIRLYSERHSKRGDLLLSHVQSILDNNLKKDQTSQKIDDHQPKSVLSSQDKKGHKP